MKAILVSKEDNQAKFNIEFTAEEVENEINEVYMKNRGSFNIDGFRKGKAPRSIIEKHYGEGIFMEEALNGLYAKNYDQALLDLDLEVIGGVSVGAETMEKGQPLVINVSASLYPLYDDIKDYNGVEVNLIETKVGDEAVDNEVEAMRKRNARIEPVERPVEDGDIVILDYSGFVGDEQFEGGTAEGQKLVIGSGQFIPGFEEQLIGVSADEEKDVKVTFPEEYHAENLAGKEAVFHCLVHEVKKEVLPELDDEFAKDVSEFDTLDELKADIKEKIQKSVDEQAKTNAMQEMVTKIRENNDVEVPGMLVEKEFKAIMADIEQQLGSQGLSLEVYCQITQTDADELKKKLREDAEKRATVRVILRSIANIENIEASQDEIDEEMGKVAANYRMELAQFKEAIGEQNEKLFAVDVVVKKTMDILYDKANVTVIEGITEAKAEELKEDAE